MKKKLLVLLSIMLLLFAPVYTTTQNVLANSKHQSTTKRVFNDRNYKGKVNDKNTSTSVLPFIKDYKTGLSIKQKINDDGTIHVRYDGNPSLIANFQTAIATWNKLGVIKFKIVDDSSAVVNVHGNLTSKEDNDNPYYIKGNLGDTNNYVDYNSLIVLSDGTKMNYISNSNIFLYSDVSKLSDNNKNHIIIHELGHALGFDDLYSQKDRGLMMFYNAQTGSTLLNKLGSDEKNSLKHYYQ
ncbi:zinc metalloprotease [Apilactobacillus quenuiae]|uniref:hypothetical protein n=1 Tax=Apilactobacillus quenuiae TaxID=2008377 RepID=UPI000D016D9E|nr:hypothetical protein [Apilactobacillus quenuiae]